MIELSIDATIPQAVEKLDQFRRRQVPFATALALTQTAADAQRQIRADLPSVFIIRSPWVARGILTTRATKRRPVASVYSRDDFMLAQEFGGTKRARRSKRIALPRGVRRNKRGAITRAQRPAALLAKAGHFTAPLGKGPGLGLYRRSGKAGSPKLLYALDPRPMTIRPRWGFRAAVSRVVRRRFERNFGKALARGIATAR